MGAVSPANGFPTFRRDALDSRPGTPINLGERPADRPLAEDLGSGRASSREMAGADGRATRHRAKLAPTYFRNLCGLKLFSWEQGDVEGR